MEFIYKRAAQEDIDLLTETRILVLRAANKLSDDVDMTVVKEQSRKYYAESLEDGTHVAYLVFDGNNVASKQHRGRVPCATLERN